MFIVNLKKHCMWKLMKNQLNSLLNKTMVMRELKNTYERIEPMRKYCTLVLNKSMCYINSLCHILNIRHCVYVSVKGSS